jgi:hypothetical protein
MSSMSPGGRGTPKKVDRTAKLRETQSSIQKRSTPSRSAKTKNSRSMRDAVSATITGMSHHGVPDVALPQSLGAKGNEVPDAECRWACMISHHQKPAMFMARALKELIERQLAAEGQPLREVWLDRTQPANREGMYDGVRHSRALVALLTKDYLTREWCIQELRWALHHRKPIVLVYVTDPGRAGVPGSFSKYFKPQLKLAFPDKSDFDHIMRNTYIEFTPDGGHDMLMLRNPQTQRGILDQMRLPARTASQPELVRICIYCAGPVLDFDEDKLKMLVSCRLGENITSANVRVARIKDRTRRAVLETAGAVGRCCRIDVHIKEDAYLSGVTTGSESDASQEEELDDAEGIVRKQVLKMFKEQVAAEKIHVVWVEQITSYVVLLEVTFVAARLLAHLAETGDHVMSELDICAVLYDGKWFGAEQATMERKLTVLPSERRLSLAAAAIVRASSVSNDKQLPHVPLDSHRTPDAATEPPSTELKTDVRAHHCHLTYSPHIHMRALEGAVFAAALDLQSSEHAAWCSLRIVCRLLDVGIPVAQLKPENLVPAAVEEEKAEEEAEVEEGCTTGMRRSARKRLREEAPAPAAEPAPAKTKAAAPKKTAPTKRTSGDRCTAASSNYSDVRSTIVSLVGPDYMQGRELSPQFADQSDVLVRYVRAGRFQPTGRLKRRKLHVIRLKQCFYCGRVLPAKEKRCVTPSGFTPRRVTCCSVRSECPRSFTVGDARYTKDRHNSRLIITLDAVPVVSDTAADADALLDAIIGDTLRV